jgi:hypothetical protein
MDQQIAIAFTTEAIKRYLEGCNIDLSLALSDLNLPINTISEQELRQHDMERCSVCSCWYSPSKGMCPYC